MEEKIYCENSDCATITINVPGKSPFVFLSKNPPIIFEGTSKRYLEVVNEFPDVIDITVDFDIADARLAAIAGNFGNNACPTNEEGGMTFSGNRFFVKNTDPRKGFLARGCRYWLYTTGQRELVIFFFDQLGEFFSASVPDINSFSYEIICDACCNETEILCKSEFYPGWKCVPLPPMSARLGQMERQIKSTK
jgi:hypothetical protein